MENIKVGDILVNKWGYEQTNIDCYQVIKRTEKMVYISKISKSIVEGGNDFKVNLLPNKDGFVGEVIRKKIINDNNKEYIKMEYGICKKWNGGKLMETSYA